MHRTLDFSFRSLKFPGRLLVLGLCLLAGPRLSAEPYATEDALITFLSSPEAQLGVFEQLQAPTHIRMGDGILSLRQGAILSVALPGPERAMGLLKTGTDSLAFMIDQTAAGSNYFVFSSDSLFDQFINAEFPQLMIMGVEEGALKSFRYDDKKVGSADYDLEQILPQMGIQPKVGGNLEFGKLPNLRDALASSLVQWVLNQNKTATLVLQDGQVSAVAGNQLTVIRKGEDLLLARYHVGRFEKVTEDRSQMVWMLLGMLIGGLVMTVVLLMGRKRKPEASEARVAEENDAEIANDAAAEMAEMKAEIVRLKAEVEAGAVSEPATHPIEAQLAAAAEDLQTWQATQGKADQEIPVKLAVANQLLDSLRTVFDQQGSEAGLRFCQDMKAELPGNLLGTLAIAGLREKISPAQVHRKIKAMHAELAETGTAQDAFVEEDLLPFLRELADRDVENDTPDPVVEYFELLRERFGNLTAKLGTMQDPPTEAEEAAYMDNLFQTALHLNDFIQVYLGAPHASTTLQNQQLILENKTVADLGTAHYETFTEAISVVPLNIRNFRYLASKAGVRSLNHVLLDGYHIPAAALRPNR